MSQEPTVASNRVKWRGADVLMAGLKSAGIRRIFTLSGNHIMPLFDAALDAGIELIHTRHEAAAVHMADAWARLTGQVGVAMVTGGPGHANAISALYTAQMAESPVLLLSGHAPQSELGLGSFQEMAQAKLAAPLCKASWTAEAPEQLARDLARALNLAASGRPGPVHLSLPQDVLDGACPPDASTAEPAPASFKLPASAASEVLALLAQARRPLLLAGPACMHSPMRQRMCKLQDSLGLPVIGMESPRGIQDPALGEFPALLARADLIVLIGKRLDFTLKFGAWPGIDAACRFIQFDAQVQELERSRSRLGKRLLHTMLADHVQTIDALQAAAAHSSHAHAAWMEEVQAGLARRSPVPSGLRRERMHPAQALAPLQALLDSHPDAVLVSDGGEFGQWAQACLKAPHRVINGVAGAIGAGISFALAARLVFPDAPVVAAMGDGTFGFHSSEIDTAVRHNLPVLLVVGNDARWNAEYQIQLRNYGAERLNGCTLLPTRYDQVTAGFGGHGELVSEPGQVLPAAERALASGLPACLNLMIEGVAAPGLTPAKSPTRKT